MSSQLYALLARQRPQPQAITTSVAGLRPTSYFSLAWSLSHRTQRTDVAGSAGSLSHVCELVIGQRPQPQVTVASMAGLRCPIKEPKGHKHINASILPHSVGTAFGRATVTPPWLALPPSPHTLADVWLLPSDDEHSWPVTPVGATAFTTQ